MLHGPGIGDDSRGLAVLVAIARALNQANVQTPGSITFVADVGEEGLGDLRGMKALFDDTLKGTVDRFVTIDGTGMSIAHTFVGSRRYRVTVKGPGRPQLRRLRHAQSRSARSAAPSRRSARFQVPAESQTTFNVGRIGGGTSVNAIPAEAWMEVDLRSVDRAALTALDAPAAARARRRAGRRARALAAAGLLTMTKELVGDRPAGATPANSIVVAGGVRGDARGRRGARVRRSVRATRTIRRAFGFRRCRSAEAGEARARIRRASRSTRPTPGAAPQRALLLTIALAQK